MQSIHYKIFGLVAIGGTFNAMEQYNVGYAAPILAEQWSLSASSLGFLNMGTFLAMAAGSYVSGIAADRYGRRPVFMVNLAIFALGALVGALAPGYAALLGARILVGIGLGGELALGFTVVAEMMPTKRRGAMTSAVSLVTASGTVLAAGLGALMLGPLSNVLGGEAVAWRWFFAVMLLPAVLLVFVRRYIPETPRYLLQKGKIAETNRVISLLDSNTLRPGRDFTVKRFINAPEGVKPVDIETTSGLRDLFHPTVARRTVIGWLLTLAMFGAMVTLNIFMPTVLVSRGFDVGSSLLYTMLINFGAIAGGVAGIVIASRVRRRTAFIGGAVVCVAFATGFGLSTNSVAAIGFSFLLICTLQMLLGVLWTYLPELFPTRCRAFGTGTCSTVGLIAGALGPLAAGALMDAYGSGAVFTLVGLLCVGIAVTAFYGPETHERDLDDLAGQEVAA
ncbi:MFS transporter [Rhodococcus erythropolis]|uniref:MFS transporter n=1 Tax=Rhodococcus erythropolis TaxID=1833 RepID=UPI002226EB59|nr:MFS transporter [Rhodococcus erythropolis]MCW2295368.1 putative MFS transporter [Rhodococcus erythropolis]